MERTNLYSFYAFWRPENAISTECEGSVIPLSAFWGLQNKISAES